MDNTKKKQQKSSMKVFESPVSSRETTPDPFEDDGEHGSDFDYDPLCDDEDDSSCKLSFSQGKQPKTSLTRIKKIPSANISTPENESSSDTTSEGSHNTSEDLDCSSSSSESIFDSHKRKCSTSKQPMRKKIKRGPKQSDCDQNSIANMSIDSEMLRRNVGDGILEDTYLLDNLEDIGEQSLTLLQNSKSAKNNEIPQVQALDPKENIQSSSLSLTAKRKSRKANTEKPPSPSLLLTLPCPPLEITPNVQSSMPYLTPKPHAQTSSSSVDATSHAQLLSPRLTHVQPPAQSLVTEHLPPQYFDTTPRVQLPSPTLDPALHIQLPSPSLDPKPHIQPPSPILAQAQQLSLSSSGLPLHVQPPPPQHPDSVAHFNQNPDIDNSNVEGNQRRSRNLSPEPAYEWENTTSDIPNFDFDEASTGVQFEITPNMSPLDIFDKLLPPHILEYIVTKTNEYGKALCSSNAQRTRNTPKRHLKYRDVDCDEMKKFLGLCLLMGQVNVPQKRKLFTYSDALYYHPIFQYVMSARIFEQILRCLCVSELNSKGKDKIVNLIDLITKNFRECYKPDKKLSLDESMLLFRGRLSFRQYIKNKKAKYGIKFYELTTSDGFVLVPLYAGKDQDHESTKGKKTEKVVMRLMRPYLFKGYWLFMDNYYNSVELAQKLVELKTHVTGTLRTNRKGNPTEITKKKLKKGQHVWVRKSKVYVSKWVDKRPVLMITTLKHPKMSIFIDRHGKIRNKPEEVAIYNKFMSGIDRTDQMVSYYSSPRKSLRWYKKVFFHIFDLAVWNSFYIYKRYCKNDDKRYDFLSFRESLIRLLLHLSPDMKPDVLLTQRNKHDNRLKEQTGTNVPAMSSDGNPSTSNNENYIGSGHWPEKIPLKPGSTKNKNYMKCKMCTKKNVRRETGLRCKGCPDKPALCAICFEDWHNQD